MSSSDEETVEQRLDAHGWIPPEQLTAWQSLLYRKRFNAGHSSYEVHYRAAVRRVNPNRISVDRMNWTADAVALARLRGEAK